MKKLSIGIIIGVIIGVASTEAFYAYLADKSDKLNQVIQYKHINSHLITNGKPEAIQAQLKSWLKFLESYKPNAHSPLPTHESIQLEKAAAYYMLATLEENKDINKHEELLALAIEACSKTSKQAKCTTSMLQVISCVTNLYSEKESCKPNKAINADTKPHA